MYSYPVDKTEMIINDKTENGEGDFAVPDGADLIWTARNRPSYSADVSRLICYFLVHVQSD